MNKILSMLLIFFFWINPLSSESIEGGQPNKIANAVETNRYFNHSYLDSDPNQTELIIEYDLEMDTGLIYHLTISKEERGMVWKDEPCFNNNL